ncbi:MAG TPA: hypothetical protein VIK81_02620 [Patescibacteria group bacterium]
MTRPDSEISVAREQEPRPKVNVAFFGYLHEPLNLEVTKYVREALDTHFQETSGRRIVLLENSDMSRSTAEMAKGQIKKYGALIPFVNGITPPGTTLPEVERIIRRVDSSDIETVIRTRLLHEDKLHAYFFHKELEVLRQKFDLEIEQESHSKEVVQRVRRLRNELHSSRSEALAAWSSGQFREGVEAWKRHYQTTSQAIIVRDPEQVDYLKQLTRKLMKEKEGGSLTVLFGGSHSHVIEVLARKLGPNVPVAYNKVDLMPEDATDFRILSGLRTGSPVEDQVYAQDFLLHCMNEFLRLHFLKKGDLSSFANNWQTIYGGVVRVVNSLSMMEMEHLVSSKSDYVGFLKNHPETKQILSFL